MHSQEYQPVKIEDIKPKGQGLFRVDPSEIEAFESSRWIKFPSGYRDYMTVVGDGTLGSFVRICTPAKIERELDEWRDRINKHWFWDRGKKLLPKNRALECVVIGDTVSGDELIFHPHRPDKIFVLPSESEQIHEAGNDLLSAIEWIYTSGKLIEKFSDITFEPYDSKKEVTKRSKEAADASDPPGESIGDITKLGRNWINRHSATKLAKKELKKFLNEGQELKLMREGIGWALN